MKAFLKKYVLDVPVFFPAALLFHFFLLVLAAFQYSDEPLAIAQCYQLGWLFAFAFLSFFFCGLKKWAAIAYVLVTGARLCCQYFLDPHNDMHVGAEAAFPFPFDVVMSSVVLFFFKRFR